jgi:hypothetical protein
MDHPFTEIANQTRNLVNTPDLLTCIDLVTYCYKIEVKQLNNSKAAQVGDQTDDLSKNRQAVQRWKLTLWEQLAVMHMANVNA